MENRSVDHPVRAQTKHIVLLILSCVLFLISLLGAWELAEAFLLPDAPSSPSDGGDGMGWIGALLGEAVQGFTLFALLAALLPCWCMGVVLAALLAMSRNDKPKWLWVASLGVAVAFGAVAAGTLAAWLLA